MAWSVAVLFAYGVIDILMGLLAFIRVHHLPSLLGGGISGILVLVAAASVAKRPKLGYGLALFVSLALLGMFASALFRKFQIYPGGIMVVLSLIAVAAAGTGLQSAQAAR